ncbi:MAG: glycoside hydrolase family 43 protein [Opitutales bacterium]|nr:glycoside hydrolase family 43 protein [Opitutales bacterium]
MSAEMITNPILPGFHPDPSMLRVGNDFYIATSTFEWFPGVRIYHSRDLRHWRFLTSPLDRREMLDMRGETASCGVWAPCLTHDGEYYYLIYSNTRSFAGPYWDVYNYLTRAKEITGPWSDPVYLNGSGFDPSLFHAPDGRKWLLNMVQDPRPGHHRFGGIEMTEYDPVAGRLVGTPEVIFKGSDLKITEGPHLYFHQGWYYLMTAEGGTGYEHAVTMARSRDLRGPYEIDPVNPMLTSRGSNAALQKAGHGSLVDTPTGEWYLAHLCGRPLDSTQRCPLGRETALQKVYWNDEGWLRLSHGGNKPSLQVAAPDLPPHQWPEDAEEVLFDGPLLPADFQTLREPPEETWLSLTERPGYLRLQGRLSLCSPFEQSLVGRRIQDFACEAETELEFSPEHYLQTAGLAAFYDDQHWFYLQVSYEETQGRVLRLVVNEQYKTREPVAAIPLPGGPVRLGAILEGAVLRFRYAVGEGEWCLLEPQLDASLLSDEVGQRYRFTGSFFVLCAQNHTLRKVPADFRKFAYRRKG